MGRGFSAGAAAGVLVVGAAGPESGAADFAVSVAGEASPGVAGAELVGAAVGAGFAAGEFVEAGFVGEPPPEFAVTGLS